MMLRGSKMERFLSFLRRIGSSKTCSRTLRKPPPPQKHSRHCKRPRTRLSRQTRRYRGRNKTCLFTIRPEIPLRQTPPTRYRR
ncbi:hypothetical protein ATCV1_z518R [Acanthocystis turfacea chlorella virus 1]|uniref:Uncharacterized protein z518R n=1 Tax=Chlorovirus heliozoae TaxID=322019 RepID=A7K9C8_9PHYC|nr:hypothetical protein ATCV1_z518R [Acanthocystis turfacea chlorella virus 1]ABT16652.1 hypothetical protein ATCV1_z518R [Acanthocystis turfacea chlorella virus 1]